MANENEKITFNWNAADIFNWNSVNSVIVDGYVLVLDTDKHTIHVRFDVRESQGYASISQAESERRIIIEELSEPVEGNWITINLVPDSDQAELEERFKFFVNMHEDEIEAFWESRDIEVLDEMIEMMKKDLNRYSKQYELVDAENYIDEELIADLREELEDAVNDEDKEEIIDEFVEDNRMSNSGAVGQIVLGIRGLLDSVL